MIFQLRQEVIFLLLFLLFSLSCKEETTKEKAIKEEIILNEFPSEVYDRVMAYKMSGMYAEVVEQGKLSSEIVGKGELLSENEIANLLAIFQDNSTYGGVAASCFEPHVGYIFYGKKNEIVAYSTVCLACNQMRTQPNIGKSILGNIGNQKLAQLEEEIFKK